MVGPPAVIFACEHSLFNSGVEYPCFVLSVGRNRSDVRTGPRMDEPYRGDHLRGREPVTRESLARIVGKSCNIDLIVDDIREELRGRPYDIVAVAGGWKHLTRPVYADAIRTGVGASERAVDLSQSEVLVLMTIAYFQPITRAELSSFFGKEISRDLIGNLRGFGLIACGPRAPQPGAPYTHVTKAFLLQFVRDTARPSRH
jgi:chromosome segregation and condensation protein ScpB